MKFQSINVLGYTGSNSQFVVKTLNTDLRINQNVKYLEQEGPNPYEYILAGFAGCLNSIGHLVAAEQGLELSSLQIEISADLKLPHPSDLARKRPVFDSIEITLKPSSQATLTALQLWLKEVQRRSPLYDHLVNKTPTDVVLLKDYSFN